MPDRSERSDVQRNREALLSAAAEVLADDPAASMDDIAAKAGLARATVYRHVTGRGDLLKQLGARALSKAEQAIAAAHPEEGPADVALLRVLEALVAEAESFRTLLLLGVGASQEFRTQREKVLAPVTALIGRGVASGMLRSDLDPRWATTALITLLRAAVMDGHPEPARVVWECLGTGWLPRS